VFLEGVSTSSSRDEPTGEPTDQSVLVAVLREQLAAERQAHAEARRIIAGLVERIPALEAPRGEARETDEAAEKTPDRAESRSAAGEAQEGVQRPQERSWWRRVFGG
jgi:hypothetical protein